MAHESQREYCNKVREWYPESFKNKRVLDIGSLDINGSNKCLFCNCEYIGLDLGKGKNVDVVCIAHEYKEPDGSFDTIISTECFEHDMYLDKTLTNIVRLLKSGGLFMFTCATIGRGEHGTIIFDPESSPFTSIRSPEWSEYYRNITEDMIRKYISIDDVFKTYGFSAYGTDLRFFGIKK